MSKSLPSTGASPTHEAAPERTLFVVLVAILALAAWLRFWRITEQSFWADEVATYVFSRYPILELVTRKVDVGNPPLYYLGMKAWMALLGSSDLALRSTSAIAGVLSVGVIYLLGRDLFGKRAGLVAALLLAISKSHIHYSQEARAYAPVVLLGILSAWLFVRAVQTHRRAFWLAAALTAAVAFYTHYSGMLIAVFEGVYALLALRRPQALRYLGLVALLLAPGMLLIVVPTFLLPHGYWYWQQRFSATALAQLANTFFGNPVGAQASTAMAVGTALLLLFAVGYPTVQATRDARREEPGHLRPVLFSLCYLLAPVLLFALIGSLKAVWYPRYLLVAWPGYLLLAAWALCRAPMPRHVLFASSLAILYALGFSHSYALTAREDWRGAAAIVQEATAAAGSGNGLVLVTKPELSVAFDYYYRGPLPRSGFGRRPNALPQETIRLVGECAHANLVFVIQERGQDGDPDLILVRGLLAQRGVGWYHPLQGIRLFAFGDGVGAAGGIPVTAEKVQAVTTPGR